jgi:hypothetical protein
LVHAMCVKNFCRSTSLSGTTRYTGDVFSIHDLPDDIAMLKRLVIESQLRLAERDHEIEHLKLLIAKLRRLQFGRSSEKFDAKIGQLELLVEELEANRAEQIAQSKSRKLPSRRSPSSPEGTPRAPSAASLPRSRPAVGGRHQCAAAVRKEASNELTDV